MASTNKPAESNGFKKPMALGSKSRSFIPMTPRSLKTNSEHRNDFAKQVAEQSHPRDNDGRPPQKKFRSSAAPKGTKLGKGYVDRAQGRQKEQDDGSEDKGKRLKALEEMFKLQQIDQATFEALRDEIGIGGDTSTTHLVKGLDFKLLERIRRGDDLESVPEPEDIETAPDVDVEDELEQALERDVAIADRSNPSEIVNEDTEQVSTAGTTLQDTPLTRDEILQRIKNNRKKPNDLTSPEPTQSMESQAKLDQSRFRKLETKPKTGKHKFTETINGRRREVLVITDKEGRTKRKTRWLDPEPHPATIRKGDGSNQAWGGDLPAETLARQKIALEEEAARQKAMEEEDEGDIFGGVADYDPLAGLDSDDEDDAGKEPEARGTPDDGKANVTDNMEEDIPPTISTSKPLKSTSKPRNYFSTTETADIEPEDSSAKRPSHDPAILAALKRAAQIRQQEDAEATKSSNDSPDDSGQTPEGQARNKALLAKLQNQSGYDDVDVDMGFGGGSRYDDEEDGEDGKQKLSQWKGIRVEGDEEEEGGDDAEKKGGAKRKRGGGGGGKKRKGDKNSFKDVMSVVEGRKKTE